MGTLKFLGTGTIGMIWFFQLLLVIHLILVVNAVILLIREEMAPIDKILWGALIWFVPLAGSICFFELRKKGRLTK